LLKALNSDFAPMKQWWPGSTSVDQIERFYAKHLPLSREMAKNLQSFGEG
jgi:hypothetical protein